MTKVEDSVEKFPYLGTSKFYHLIFFYRNLGPLGRYSVILPFIDGTRFLSVPNLLI
jgi:hypothetical protein